MILGDVAAGPPELPFSSLSMVEDDRLLLDLLTNKPVR